MIKKILFSAFLYFTTININAQVVVDNTTPPYNSNNHLINNVLLGSGVAVSNISFIGNANQIGFFKNGTSSIGLDSGVVLSSGNVNDIPNGGNQPSTDYSGVGDNDLMAIAQTVRPGITSSHDAATLEFDFLVAGDTVAFRFVFASEEYTLYSQTDWNDIFAFFLSGPGISGPYAAPAGFPNGAANFALVPGTNTPITISTIYSDPTKNPPQVNGQYYIDNPSGIGVDFNGYTTIMEIKVPVQCSGLYHFKFAIADCQDGILDSGVFLEANSFSSNGSFLVDIITATGDSTVIEGCSDATICFSRADTTSADTVPLFLTGAATNGIDYNLLPDTLYFPAGQSSVCLTISPIADGINEGMEDIIITVPNINVCGDTVYSTGTIYIVDAPDINIITTDLTLNCPTSGLTINSSASGGLAPYDFTWINMNGDTLGGSQNLTTPVNQTDTFIVIVTDSCNLTTAYDTVIITIATTLMTVSAGNDITLICPGQSVTLISTVNGGSPGYTFNWTPGNVNTPNYTIPAINQTTTYVLQITDACNTSVYDTVTVNVNYTPLQVTGNSGDSVLNCIGNDHLIDIYTIVTNGTAPYTFAWSNSSNDSLVNVNVTSPTTYYVTVTDVCNFTVTDTINFTFTPYTPMSIAISGDDSICIGSITPLTAIVNDGYPPYSYYWSDGISFSGNGNPIDYSTLNAGSQFITLSVTDQCNITEQTTYTIEAIACEVIIPNIFTPNGDGSNDFLVFKNLQYFPDNKLVIFNRWGKKIYEKTDYQNDWNGDNHTDGTYFFILELNDFANTLHKGSITILR
jgi:gliding motility-associated-like protein